jgi:ADP-heptose:LPS heptosyltransferase
VGDVVRTLPAVSSLRAAYAGAHITWLVEPAASGAVEGQPWIDEILVFPRNTLRDALGRLEIGTLLAELTRFLRTLRRRRFELVVDFHAILRSGVLSMLTGAPARVSYARPFGRELAYLFATHRARVSPARMSRFERNEGLVRYLGIRAEPSVHPMAVDPAARLRIQSQLAPGPRPVAIHAGTSDATPHKRYSVEGYASVASALAEEAGVPSIVTRGPARDDRVLAEAVVAKAGGAARLAPATPTLADLAALFASCRLYVGGDTGPMHVASLVGTPVVQILGPTDRVENAPYPGTPSRTVRAPEAGPAGRGSAARLRSLPPAAVVAAARALLAESGAPGSALPARQPSGVRGKAAERPRSQAQPSGVWDEAAERPRSEAQPSGVRGPA